MITLDHEIARAATLPPPYPAQHRRPRVRWTERARYLATVLCTLGLFAFVCSAALVVGAGR